MSPATSKMLLKTIRDSDSTSQELHICAIFCSAKSIQLLHQVPMFERQVDINSVVGQYHQILKALVEKDTGVKSNYQISNLIYNIYSAL